jgi:hypothetical protein
MNSELDPTEPQTEKITITMAHVSSAITFLLIAGIVAIGGAWCFSQAKESSKKRGRSWSQMFADQQERRLLDIQDEISAQFDENMLEVSELQEELAEQNGLIMQSDYEE